MFLAGWRYDGYVGSGVGRGVDGLLYAGLDVEKRRQEKAEPVAWHADSLAATLTVLTDLKIDRDIISGRWTVRNRVVVVGKWKIFLCVMLSMP